MELIRELELRFGVWLVEDELKHQLHQLQDDNVLVFELCVRLSLQLVEPKEHAVWLAVEAVERQVDLFQNSCLLQIICGQLTHELLLVALKLPLENLIE